MASFSKSFISSFWNSINDLSPQKKRLQPSPEEPPLPPQALAVLPLEKVVVLPIIFTKKRRFDAAEKNEKPKAQNDNETEKQAAKRKRDAVSTATYKNSLGQSGIAKPSRVYLNTPHSDIDIEIEL